MVGPYCNKLICMPTYCYTFSLFLRFPQKWNTFLFYNTVPQNIIHSRCPTPPFVENADVSYSDSDKGSTLECRCHRGHRYSDGGQHMSAICKTTLQWSDINECRSKGYSLSRSQHSYNFYVRIALWGVQNLLTIS